MDQKNIFNAEFKTVKTSNLKGKYHHAWLEESLDIEQQANKKLAISHTQNYLGSSIGHKKTMTLAILILLIFTLIIFRLFFLQGLKGNYYRGLAEGNRIRLQPIFAQRGIFFDREGKELVQNVPNFAIALIPQDLPKNAEKQNEIINKVVESTNVNRELINELLKKYGPYSYASLVIKENLDYESALKLYIESSNLPGMSIAKGSKRNYTLGNIDNSSSTISLSHLFGYVGKLNDQEYENLKSQDYLLFDNIGKSGLEKKYESFIRGKHGKKKVEVDAMGHEQTVLAEEPPEPGKNLILTLDSEAQAVMENLIKQKLKETGKKRAAGIAINPQDGSVLALVSWPSFNANKFSGGISKEDYKKYAEDADKPLFNRAIGGTYPPGSTIKLIASAAALQEKIITYQTTFLSTGGLRLGKWFFKDWKAGGHGITNVTKAIAWSINTFFYYIGGGYGDFAGLGVDQLTRYMRLFGLASATGIDLPGEASGFLPSKDWKYQTKGERWYAGDTYNLSIGQGDVLVTPAQVAVWTAAIANGGYRVRPHLVHALEDPETHKKNNLSFIKQDTKIAADNIAIVRQGMRECAQYGSCKLLRALPFSSGGKTGTAQWNNNKENHAWFTSFAPAEYPQIVVTVLVEEGGEGAGAAALITRDFLKWWGKKYLK